MQVGEQQSLAKEQHDTAAAHLKQATAEADARLAQVGLLLNPYHSAAARIIQQLPCVCGCVCTQSQADGSLHLHHNYSSCPFAFELTHERCMRIP